MVLNFKSNYVNFEITKIKKIKKGTLVLFLTQLKINQGIKLTTLIFNKRKKRQTTQLKKINTVTVICKVRVFVLTSIDVTH